MKTISRVRHVRWFCAGLSERGQRVARLEASRESDIAVNSVIGKMDTKEQAQCHSPCRCSDPCFNRFPFGGWSGPCFAPQVLLGFEPQLLSYRLPVKVYVLRADLIALNLSKASHRIGDGTACRRSAVHERTGVRAA